MMTAAIGLSYYDC